MVKKELNNPKQKEKYFNLLGRNLKKRLNLSEIVSNPNQKIINHQFLNQRNKHNNPGTCATESSAVKTLE